MEIVLFFCIKLFPCRFTSLWSPAVSVQMCLSLVLRLMPWFIFLPVILHVRCHIHMFKKGWCTPKHVHHLCKAAIRTIRDTSKVNRRRQLTQSQGSKGITGQKQLRTGRRRACEWGTFTLLKKTLRGAMEAACPENTHRLPASMMDKPNNDFSSVPLSPSVSVYKSSTLILFHSLFSLVLSIYSQCNCYKWLVLEDPCIIML